MTPSHDSHQDTSASSNSTPTILSVAYPYAPVGPEAVGGAEVVLTQLEAVLESSGFRSIVVAHHTSHPAGRLYPVDVAPGEITPALREEVDGRVQRAIDQALADNPVALIHMHGLDFHRYRLPAGIPILVTLHLPPAWYPPLVWSLPSTVHLLCVSESERAACPPDSQARLRVIANGVPLPDPAMLRPEGRYALMLARICEEKNLHVGLQAARLAGIPSVLAGDVFPYVEHQRYFHEQIEPLLTHHGTEHIQRDAGGEDHATARFLGPVTGAAKTRLLVRARCLLLPSLAPETSSLVAMEALAAGVPVIAMASGALPEIITHGENGFLVPPGPDAVNQMADAIARLPELSRSHCRMAAEQRFSIERMLQGYLQLYRTLAQPVAAQTSTPFRNTEEIAPAPSQMQITHLATGEELSAIAAEWEALWHLDTHATPFQHPAWLLPWWRQFGSDGRLHTLCMRNQADGGLHALAPLYTLADTSKTLLLVGAGTSDYLDGIWRAPASSAPLASALLRFAAEEIADWQQLSFSQLRTASPFVQVAEHTPKNETLTLHPAEPCSVLALDAPLPAKLAANTRRYRRRAEAQGALALRLAETPTDALRFFASLQHLHHCRWTQRQEPSVLADPRVVAHHSEALPAMLAAGLLRLFQLSLGAQELGILYALCDPAERMQCHLYLYLIGFDPKFSDLSPGTLLLHAVWEYAKQHGYTHLDLLRGGEDYKRLWGAVEIPTLNLSAVL